MGQTLNTSEQRLIVAAVLLTAEGQITRGSVWGLRGVNVGSHLAPAFDALLQNKTIEVQRSGQVALTEQGQTRLASIRIEN